MHYKKLIPLLFIFSQLFATEVPEAPLQEVLLQKLSQAYTRNNTLIHQSTPPQFAQILNQVTDNYIEQIKHFKTLSDQHLQRQLKAQETDHARETLLLQNHIVNLYEKEIDLHRQSEPRSTDVFADADAYKDWELAKCLIPQVVQVLNSAGENPSIIYHLSGSVKQSLLHQRYQKALKGFQEGLNKPLDIKVERLIELPSMSFHCKSYYVLGKVLHDNQWMPYLCKLILQRNEHGIFVENIAEVIQAQDIERFKKHLIE